MGLITSSSCQTSCMVSRYGSFYLAEEKRQNFGSRLLDSVSSGSTCEAEGPSHFGRNTMIAWCIFLLTKIDLMKNTRYILCFRDYQKNTISYGNRPWLASITHKSISSDPNLKLLLRCCIHAYVMPHALEQSFNGYCIDFFYLSNVIFGGEFGASATWDLVMSLNGFEVWKLFITT